MAFTPEQQSQIDFQNEIENNRHSNQTQLEVRRMKLEVVRLAKETLLENSRSKPVDSRNVSADDIKNYAQNLIDYING